MPKSSLTDSFLIHVLARLLVACLLLPSVSTSAQITNGQTSFSADSLQPGISFSLNGEWLYKPGYAFSANDQPQFTNDLAAFLPIPVPQILNRIYWWLDDSEDFKKAED